MSNTDIGKATVKKIKSRNQSPLEFYESLQLEYICAELRAKIYPKISDKNYWRRVQNGKKESIESFATRNNLPSIFDDSDLERDMKKIIYKEKGYPNFIYKDEEQKTNQEYRDKEYYYNVGAQVRLEYFSEIKIATIIEYRPFSSNITLKIENVDENVVVKVSEVTRIL